MANAPSTPPPPPPSSLATLKEQLSTLEALEKQVQAARNLPKAVFQANPLELRKAFEDLDTLAVSVRRPEVQNALVAATESEQKDPSELDSPQRDFTHAILPTSRESPTRIRRPNNGPLLLPSRDHALNHRPMVTIQSLSTYIRDFNKQHDRGLENGSVISMLVYSKHRGSRVLAPHSRHVTLRIVVRGLFCAYLKLSSFSEDGPLRIVSVTCVGFSEPKLPHEYSDYVVFQHMSQHFARLLSERSDMSIALFMDLFCTYDELFTLACCVCGNLLSRTGRVPPVARIWNDEEEVEALPTSSSSPSSSWQPCHSECVR